MALLTGRLHFLTLCINSFLACLTCLPCYGHVPHDVVFELASSPSLRNKNTVYAIVRGNLMKSTNQGKTWTRKIQGLDNTTELHAIAFTPSNKIYLTTEGDGIYRSINAGKSFKKFNQGLGNFAFTKMIAVGSKSSETVYAASSKKTVYRYAKADNGWVKVYDGTAPITAISGIVDVNGNNKVYLGDNQGKLLASSDNGKTWQLQHRFSDCGEISGIGVSPDALAHPTLLVATQSCGIFRTKDDASHSFQSVNRGLTDLNITTVRLSPTFSTDSIAFATSWREGVFKSNNSGLTWRKLTEGTTIGKGASHQADAQNKPYYHGIDFSADFNTDRTVFIGGFDGIFKSTDEGFHWQKISKAILAPLIQSIAISPTFSEDHSLITAAYVAPLQQTKNGGKTWRTTGPDNYGRNFDVAFSPDYAIDKTIFSTSQRGLSRSTDAGKTWSNPKLSRVKAPTIIKFSPNFAVDHTLFLADRLGGIHRSNDSGKTFRRLQNALKDRCNTCISGFEISPNFSIDHLMFTATTKGLSLSTDGGDSWVVKVPPSVFGKKNVQLAISPDFLSDHRLYLASKKGLYLTTDNFSSWHKLTGKHNEISGFITALAISPQFQRDKTLFVTVKGKGLYKSEDGGLSFKPQATKLLGKKLNFEWWDEFPEPSASPIRFSPNYQKDKTIFAIGSDRIYISQNTGRTWQLLPK